MESSNLSDTYVWYFMHHCQILNERGFVCLWNVYRIVKFRICHIINSVYATVSCCCFSCCCFACKVMLCSSASYCKIYDEKWIWLFLFCLRFRYIKMLITQHDNTSLFNKCSKRQSWQLCNLHDGGNGVRLLLLPVHFASLLVVFFFLVSNNRHCQSVSNLLQSMH